MNDFIDDDEILEPADAAVSAAHGFHTDQKTAEADEIKEYIKKEYGATFYDKEEDVPDLSRVFYLEHRKNGIRYTETLLCDFPGLNGDMFDKLVPVGSPLDTPFTNEITLIGSKETAEMLASGDAVESGEEYTGLIFA